MRLWALLLAALPALVMADVERSLGKSPDGHWELILTAESEKDLESQIILRHLTNGKIIETDSSPGYGTFAFADVEAFWKNSSDAFALTLRGTKRTWHTEVYIRKGNLWEKLKLPAYVENILGRQGVLKAGRSFHESFGGFQGEHRFTLFSHVEPDWQQQEAAKATDWKPATQTDWKIELQYDLDTLPNCNLISITPISDESTDQREKPKR